MDHRVKPGGDELRRRMNRRISLASVEASKYLRTSAARFAASRRE
jgi:hypothetical protein